MAANKKKTEKKTSGKETSEKKGRYVQEELKPEKKKNISRGKDIAMVLIFGVAVLIFVSFFSDGLSWLKQGTYFVFGLVTYVFPLLLVVCSWVLMYHSNSGSSVIRGVGMGLCLFAISGILDKINQSAEFNWSLGGLPGKLDRLIFVKAVGEAGSYVIDGVIILISIILLTNFSIFAFLGEKTDPKSKANQERKKRRMQDQETRKLERESKELEKQNAALEHRSRVQYDLEDLRNENLMRQEKIRKQQEYEDRLARRQIPVVGIGDTLIRDDSTEPIEESFFPTNGKTVFHPTDDAEVPAVTPEPSVEHVDAQDDDKEIPIGGFIFNNNSNEAETDNDDYVGNDDYQKTVITGRSSTITRISGEGEDETPEPKKFTRSTRDFNTASDDSEELKPKTAEKPQKPYRFPPLRLLKKGSSLGGSKSAVQAELQEKAKVLKDTLAVFGVNATITNIACGPSVTRFEIQPELGTKVNTIVSLSNDIKMALAATDIRMEAPIPGKSAIGIEIPNAVRQPVLLRDPLETDQYKESKSKIAFVLGRDIEGNVITPDLGKMPHLLIAGTTGSGKSVCINSMIISLLYHANPSDVKFIMIDPKVVELSSYNDIPHLLFPVVTNPKKAAMALAWAVSEMDKRYEQFAESHVNNIESFNEFAEQHPLDDEGNERKKMPKIIIIIDELADLMMTSPKEVEDYICRLAQKARAAGIHLVIATQSPRVNVLTGLIKANVPSRIALKVASQMDSRVIIDMNGAEKLVGNGDLLYAPAGLPKPIRVQGTFVSEDEVNEVVAFIKSQGKVIGSNVEEVKLSDVPMVSGSSESNSPESEFDEYFTECGRLIIDSQKASISMLQRRFKLGFNRAARIMDQLCENGVVGEEQGTKPREILMTMDEFENFLSNR